MSQEWVNHYFEVLAAAMKGLGYRNPMVHRFVREDLIAPPLPQEIYAVRVGDPVLERMNRKLCAPFNELHRGAHATARALLDRYEDMPACMMLWHSAVAFWLNEKLHQIDFEDPRWREVVWLMRQIDDGPKGPWQPGDNPFVVEMKWVPVPRAEASWLACTTAMIAVMNARAFEIVSIR